MKAREAKAPIGKEPTAWGNRAWNVVLVEDRQRRAARIWGKGGLTEVIWSERRESLLEPRQSRTDLDRDGKASSWVQFSGDAKPARNIREDLEGRGYHLYD